MSSQNVQTSSSSTTSSVRPRPKRLISGIDDGDETELPETPGIPPSPFDSRSASPIPSAHPQRSSSRNPNQKFTGTSWGRRAQIGASTNGQGQPLNSPTLAGLWGTSWTTLQGIASDFLGNEQSDGQAVKDNKKLPLPKWYRQMTMPPKEGTNQWGPPPVTSAAASTSIGTGTKGDRESALRAQKRKDMLLRQDTSYPDTLGKFKRRLSDDMESRSAPPGENDDRASLVYLHHVLKDDTMAGITIKYNCSANVLRKANRMWANDTPQSRQVMVIPVGECGVKGRPVDAPTEADLLDSASKAPLSESNTAATKAAQTNGNITHRERTDSQTTSSAVVDPDDPPWHHDSWVQLPGFASPTEIARLSRRTLGYFPPARRKSISDSTRNTPRASHDLTRVSTEDRTDSRSPQRPRRERRLSNANNGYFPSYLAGPGGVGTMNKNVRTPGPAQDGLNKIFAKHLPDVAPPKNQVDLYHPEIPLYSDEFTPSTSGFATPTGGRNVNIENVGGAIESWARRMVSKATMPSEAQARNKAARASVGTPGKGAGGIGDLIEMTDEFEIGGDEEDEDDGVVEQVERGRQGGGSAAAKVTVGSQGVVKGGQLAQYSGSGEDYFGDAAGRGGRGVSETNVGGGKGRKTD